MRRKVRYYGGDYNPEQWPEAVWDEDIALMRRARVNLVSVGVFSWALLEPREGEYDFGWLDRILDRLDAAGIGVALATPTASPPPWFSLTYPDALPITWDGVRLTHGSRDTYCASAPAYRRAAAGIAGALAERYGGHPGVKLWHVHNEYGTLCYCEHTAAAFRLWLRARYGTIERLNEAWTTAFWSQTYQDWEQVRPPRATQYLDNPAHTLDFRRFTSDELLAAFKEQRDVIRAFSTAPVTTNFVLAGWVPVEPWSWAAEVDLVAIDHYPDAADRSAEEQTAFAADLARGWAGPRPWLLLEQAPNLIYTRDRMLAKEPGRMATLSLSHIARGSIGAMFFQWRQPPGGAEQFHSAMVPHAGPDSRVFREVVELGEILANLPSLPAEVAADVAILWDSECWWALSHRGMPSTELDYSASLHAVHAALYQAGVTVDFARPGGDLSSYRLVLIPSLYLVSDEAASVIRSYVEAGGHLAVWYFSGIADPGPRIRLGGYPGAFREVLGVRVEEFAPLVEPVKLSTGDTGAIWSERVGLAGAEAVAEYPDGSPAITRHRYRQGLAWYVSTGLDGAGLARLLAEITAAAGVDPVRPDLPEGVEAVRRGDRVLTIDHRSFVWSLA